MADSGIERTLVLPDPVLPTLFKSLGLTEDALLIREYLRELNEKIAAAYDDLAKRMNEFLVFQEWQSSTPPTITADQNAYILPDDGIVIKMSSDVNHSINGIAAPQVERFIILLNTGAADVTVPYQSATATAENRILVSGGTTLTLAPGQSMALWYDLGIQRWRQLML